MDTRLRQLLLVLSIGGLWAILWPTIGLAIMVVLTAALGPNGDIDPLEMAAILGRLGLPAGLIFGVIVGVVEPRRVIAAVASIRIVAYGVIAAVVTGIVAGLQPSAIMNACVLGGVSGSATLVVARTYSVRHAWRG